ncbi:hypothetical protein MBT42_12650 [Streptomyces sp. MBT42]|uniref:hypothetical protein n=1 Tax=Streptomyces sp. MBT42 TaxID=1488373 RepID=UPI001E3D8055|nr:hypothetical protein [Streptomyces sp. MBT42]MCD2464405.1 hypothetical protein [Streptomyces sp. MBT42]
MTPAETRMHNLLAALSDAALDLASSAAHLARPAEGPEFGLKYMGEVMRTADAVEELVVAVLRHSGVSWDALASYRGVSRQSLHRRLAESVDQATERSQPLVDMHLEHARLHLDVLKRSIKNLDRTFEASLEPAAVEWRRRVHMPGWWWKEYDARA